MLGLFSLLLVFPLSLGTSVTEEDHVITDLGNHPELKFSPCSLAHKVSQWRLPHLQKVAHPGFWACMGMFNSAKWNDVEGSFGHNCQENSVEKGGVRCAKDLYGFFNAYTRFWCKHKHPLPGDGPSENYCNIDCEKLVDADLTDDFVCLNKIMHDYHTPKIPFEEATIHCCSYERYYRVLGDSCPARLRELSKEEPMLCRFNVTQSERAKTIDDERKYYKPREGPAPMRSGRLDVNQILDTLPLNEESELSAGEFKRNAKPLDAQLDSLAGYERELLVTHLRNRIAGVVKDVLSERAGLIQWQFSREVKEAEDDFTEDVLKTFVTVNPEYESLMMNFARSIVKAYIVQDYEFGSENTGLGGKIPDQEMSGAPSDSIRGRREL